MSGDTRGSNHGTDRARPLPKPPRREQVGHLRRLFQDPQPVLDDLRAKYGPVVGLGAGPVSLAIVGGPTALRELFAMSTASFRWGHKFNVLGFVVGEQSMIVSDGDDHKRRRSSVQSAFSRRRLNSWIPMIVERTDATIDALVADTGRAGTDVDLYPLGRALVLDIVVRALFAVDIVIGGRRIPKGTLILWSAHLAGRDPDAWTDPLRFDPDRFVDPSPEQRALADAAWVPFGRGPRNCIGFALAQMELTLIVSRLAQRIDIATTRNDAPRPVGMVVNRPAGGASMRVSPR